MATNSYRLGEYKIIESGMGKLRWEAHSGFAALAEGRCFRNGTILFIGQSENDQIGFLKGDFLDHIEPFPAWSKTRYYCSAFDMYRCDTGKKVAKQEMLAWTLDTTRGEGGRPPKEGTFRLGRCEITRNAKGQIIWKTAPGPNTISQGACAILEDILFIGPGENSESDSIGRRFAKNLQILPKWDQTEYYCPKQSLCDCRSWRGANPPIKTRSVARKGPRKHDDTGKVGKRILFKSTELGRWKRRAVIFFNGAMKSFVDAAKGLRSIISVSFDCAIGFGKEIKRMSRFKEAKGSPVHPPKDQM